MKVLLVSEGKHESGGSLAALVERLLAGPCEFDWRRMSDNTLHVHQGTGPRLRKRAAAWIAQAERDGYDAIVLVVDQDGKLERGKQLEDAQGDANLSLPRALGIAIRTFDAWILADETALSMVLQFTVPTQSDPESNPAPKADCAKLLKQSCEVIGQAEMYAKVAQVARLEVLERRCPKGFAVFALRVRVLRAVKPGAVDS